MKTKQKQGRKSAARLVMGLIAQNGWADGQAKDSLARAVKAVKAAFPKSKFGLSQYSWYLSRYRRQRKLRLDTAHIVQVPAARKAARKGKKARAS